jgi:glycosyltransferase involved in cell wall biosynthesis
VRHEEVGVAKLCVIRQFYYPLDPRVRREVEGLVMSGHEVDIICMRQTGERRREQYGPITVYRLPLRHRRGGLFHYAMEYGAFLIMAMLFAGALHLRRRYALVQVNSMPDFLVFAALIPRLLGARVLLDLHECVPEFFSTKFAAGPRHPGVRLMAFFEQASIGFADFAITCTEQMREAFVARGAAPEKIGLILNAADETIWDAKRYPSRRREPGRFELILHGSIEDRYGHDTVIRAVGLLKDELPGLCLKIYGDGSFLPEARRLTKALGIESQVYFSGGYVPLEELLRAVADADAGVVAMKRDAFRDLTHCHKMYDFIAMHKPVITSRTRAVEAYFDDACFQYFTSDNPADLARAIRELYADPGLGECLVQRTAQISEPYRWQHQRDRYREFVRRMLEQPGTARAAEGAPAFVGVRTSRLQIAALGMLVIAMLGLALRSLSGRIDR